MSWMKITKEPIGNLKRSRLLGKLFRQFDAVNLNASEIDKPTELERLKKQFICEINDKASLEDKAWLLATVRLLFDLFDQGWRIKLKEKNLFAMLPEKSLSRDTIRKRFVSRRNEQLRQPSIRKFISEMESWKRYKGKNVSILSLMTDGRELAKTIKTNPSSNDWIKPYLQVVISGQRCDKTGYYLTDIWRYFRHSWSNPYESIPGRSILFIVRDSARNFHPVIGISALSSASVSLSVRDKFIGWDTDEVLQNSSFIGEKGALSWIESTIKNAIDNLYTTDFITEGIIPINFVKKPTPKLIQELENLAKLQRETHHRMMEKSEYSDIKTKHGKTSDWEKIAKTPLFKSKRAVELANLLRLWIRLQELISDGNNKDLRKNKKYKELVAKVVKLGRSNTVGTEIADMTVCGAVAPYNHLIAGKLVAMLTTSPQAVNAYKEKYETQESIIASSMAGKAVTKSANLVFVGTTSLYGVRPNQYDRTSYPTSIVGGGLNDKIKFAHLQTLNENSKPSSGTKGVGTFQFSSGTLRSLEEYCVTEKNGWRVNNVFGEGANPKLRAIREGVEALGFIAQQLITHGITKNLYGVKLASNLPEYLLGKDETPNYLFSFEDIERSSSNIADWWFERWAQKRLADETTLKKISSENFIHPIRHNAVVKLPEMENPQISLI